MQLTKLITLCLMGLLIPIYLSAQTDDLDKLMTKHQINCLDVSDNCHLLIPEYYQRGRLDSVALLLAYWEQKCGLNEKIEQTKFLLSISNRTFDDKTLKIDIFNELLQRNRSKNSSNLFTYHGYYKPDTTFNFFINNLAKNTLNKDLTKTEAFLVKSYIDKLPTNLKELEKEVYNNTVLQSLYKQYKQNIFQQPEFLMGFYTGYFNPLGNNKLLGNKFILGAYMGCKFNKNQIEVLADIKGGDAKQKYSVIQQGKSVETDKYTGVYLGVEYNRALITTYKSEFLILTGVGGERITAIFEDKTTNTKAKFLWTPTFNGGFGFRHYFFLSKTGYHENIPFWGLQFRFNYLNFINTGGTDISGHAYSIRFVFGASNNYKRRILYEN